MKTMNWKNGKIAVGLALSLFGAQLSQAAPATEFSKDFAGKMDASLAYLGVDGGQIAACSALGPLTWLICGDEGGVSLTKDKNTHLTTSASLNVRSAGEGKVFVRFKAASAKGCAGFQKIYKGFETAFGVYNLYLVTNEHPEPTPYDSHAEAQVTLDGDRASVNLLQNLKIQTVQKGGHTCTWAVSTDDAIEMRGGK